jgi:hypothetical protein
MERWGRAVAPLWWFTIKTGTQTICVPPYVPVTEAAPVKMTLTQRDTIYVATTKQPNGPLTTDKVLFIAGAEFSNTAQ